MSFLTLARRFRGALKVFLALSLTCSVSAKKVSPDALTVGEPETGATGIARKSADINAASAVADAARAIHGKKFHNFPHASRGGEVEFPEATGSTGGTGSDLPPPSFLLNPKIATPGLNFTAATVNDCSGYPPDTMGVVGPSQFIIALNGRIRSFNKTNGTMDNGINADTDVFYQPVLTPGSNFTSDPRIRYDRLSQRWYILMIDVPGQQGTLPNRIMIAVSDGPVITGSTVWTFFQFQAETSDFADYPTLGVDANALYIGCNIFSASSGSFVDTSGYVVRKSSILGAGPIVVTKFTGLTGGRVSGPYTPQGVDNLYNPSATEGYFIGIDLISSTTMQLRRVSNPGGTPTLSANVPFTVGTFDSPMAPSVLGSTFAIDGLDERLLAAHFRNGSIWTAHNVGLNSSGNNSTHPNRDGVRWYQITNIPTGSTPSVFQSGTVVQTGTATNLSYWMGTIMVSGQGHAALGMTVAGPNHFLDAAATGRYASDALGTMQTPFTYTASSAGYNPSDGATGSEPHRWGDYSMTSLDPNDDMTMWTVQEWCSFSANGFAVQVAKLPAPPPATPTSCTPSTVVAGSNNVNIVVTGSSTSASGFFDPGPGFSNHIAVVVNGGGMTVNSVNYTDPTHITLNISVAANASAGTRTITVTNPDGQSITSSAILTVTSVAANKLTMAIQPSPSATAGIEFAVQPVVRIENSFGDLMTNDNSTIVTAARSAGAGTLQGTKSMTAVNGLVTFTNLSHQYATNITIVFSSGSLLSATSSVVAVSSAAFSQVQILVPGQNATPTVSPGRTGTPTAHVSGTSFNVTVNAVDAFWNFVSSVTDTVSLSSSDSIAILPSNTALTAGTTTLNVTLKTVGSQNLAASDVSQGGIGTDTSPNMSITPATLTVVANNASRVYGQTNPVFGGTLTGVQGGDNITASFSSTATTNSSKGTYSIVPGLNDPNNRLGNYTVLSTNGTLTITAAPLSVIASNVSRQYGATNPIFSGSIVGLQNNDNITATFSSSATTNSAVGNYSIIPTLTDPSSKLSNYTVTTNGTLTVTNASLTVNANSASRQYGKTNPVFSGTIVGLQNNDNVTATYTSAATTNSAVGSYNITPVLSDPTSKLSNYTVTTNTGTLNVTNAMLSVTASNAPRQYGQTNPALSGSLVGLQNNDNISATFSTSATTSSAVGSYPIAVTLSDPSNKLPNYTVTTNNGTLTVTNAPLTVTASNLSRQYGQTNPVFGGSIVGLQNGDSITATFTCNATTNSVVGSYPITAALSDPSAKLSNYTVTTNNGALTVNQAPLNVGATSASRRYGDFNPLISGTIVGLKNNDDISATFGCAATTNSPVGIYPLTTALTDPSGLLPNYAVTTNNGTLTITNAPLTITASNASRQYGQPNPVFSGSLVGLQNNDNITVTFSSSATTNSAVGNYAIKPTLVDPTSKLSNYTVTTNNGILSVTTGLLSVTASNASRAWGAPNPAFTGSIAGIQNNDNITAIFSTTATSNSSVGTYPITFTLSDPGTKLSNYTVATNNGVLTVFNSAPTINAVADQLTGAGSVVSLTVPASDPDSPYQTLSFSLDPGAPSGANIDATSGGFTWTPPPGSEGTTNPVTVRVTDNAVPSQSATTTFNIVVIDRPKLLAIDHNTDGSVSVQWSTVPGAVYHFQFKDALSDALWTDLTQFTANASVTTTADISTQTRFYRLAAGFTASDPAGVIPLTLLGSSDSYISIPFSRPIAEQESIMSISNNVVTFSNASWTVGQFVYLSGVQSNSYYARFDSGALEGRAYGVLSNDANSLTLDLGSDTVDAAVVGDVVSIIPYWTLASAFRNGDGVFASPAPGNRFTEILLPDNAATGFNLSSSNIYFFNAGIWKQVGQGASNHGDDILALNSYFIVRQNVSSNSTMTALGAVVLPKLSITLRTDSSTSQDNALALTRASAVSLNDSGLISSGGFTSSPLPGSRTDELLTFDNASIAKNKSSSAVYYYWNSAWRRVGSGSADVGADAVFTPGTGFIIRKATNTTSVVWTNAP